MVLGVFGTWFWDPGLDSCVFSANTSSASGEKQSDPSELSRPPAALELKLQEMHWTPRDEFPKIRVRRIFGVCSPRL